MTVFQLHIGQIRTKLESILLIRGVLQQEEEGPKPTHNVTGPPVKIRATARPRWACETPSLCPVNKLEGLPEESARAQQLILHTGLHRCTWVTRINLRV